MVRTAPEASLFSLVTTFNITLLSQKQAATKYYRKHHQRTNRRISERKDPLYSWLYSNMQLMAFCIPYIKNKPQMFLNFVYIYHVMPSVIMAPMCILHIQYVNINIHNSSKCKYHEWAIFVKNNKSIWVYRPFTNIYLRLQYGVNRFPCFLIKRRYSVTVFNIITPCVDTEVRIVYSVSSRIGTNRKDFIHLSYGENTSRNLFCEVVEKYWNYIFL